MQLVGVVLGICKKKIKKNKLIKKKNEIGGGRVSFLSTLLSSKIDKKCQP